MFSKRNVQQASKALWEIQASINSGSFICCSAFQMGSPSVLALFLFALLKRGKYESYLGHLMGSCQAGGDCKSFTGCHIACSSLL